jgi:hypothetical protein
VNAYNNQQIPVVDVDQAFPAMVDRSNGSSGGDTAGGGVSPQVAQAVRDVLGMRPRTQDPKAFLDALKASFNLRLVEGHTVADYVPRGAAVQSDLGAVTGGQASLYRRATIARTEALRILDSLTALRPDADADDMASYRTLVRDSVQRLVDELGNPGGPRVQMVNMYFAGLTGAAKPAAGVDADGVTGQLGALRDRFGLTDANSNTVDDEAVRTSFWTLVDLITDLQTSWRQQRQHFTSQAGQGFLGTDLILLSRLMEAAADQVDELERVLGSVLIPETERRTIVLHKKTGLTLDGLLTWLRTFLGDEGRRIAQDTGRDGIVSALAPMAVELVKTFRDVLADRVNYGWRKVGDQGEGEYAELDDERCCPVLYLPVGCCSELPAGMYSARVRVAVASLCRLLMDLARTAQRIGRYARPTLLNVTFRSVFRRDDVVEVDIRGINLRPEHIPAFYIGPWVGDDCSLDQLDPKQVIRPLRGSSTTDDDSIVAFFRIKDIDKLLTSYPQHTTTYAQADLMAPTSAPDSAAGKGSGPGSGGGGQVTQSYAWASNRLWDHIKPTSSGEGNGAFTTPAEVWPLVLFDGESGRPAMAPMSVTYPQGLSTLAPVPVQGLSPSDWNKIRRDERFRITDEPDVHPGPNYPRAPKRGATPGVTIGSIVDLTHHHRQKVAALASVTTGHELATQRVELLSERLPNARGDRKIELEQQIGKAESEVAATEKKIATLTPEVADLEQQIDRAHAAMAGTNPDTPEGE